MDIKQLQQINLETIKKLNEFLLQNNIKYFLDAGTLLGAVRHNGFIPWDDDVDVVMTRENFNKFNDLCKNNKLPKPLLYKTALDQWGNNNFFDFVPRIFNTNYIIRENIKYKNEMNGVFQYPHIDIFILDEVDNNKIKKAQFMQKIIYGLAMGHRKKLDYNKYNLIQKIQVKVLASIGKHISIKKIYNMQKKCSVKYNTKYNQDFMYYSNYEPAWQYMCIKKEWIKEYCQKKFEDIILPIPNGYDYILKMLYGNYMQLPSKEKQIASHEEMF